MGTSRARTNSAKLERRRHILATATACLSADGLQAVSMQDIASACGLTKPALYRYFTTREELLLAVYRILLNDWLAAFNKSLLATADHPLPRAAFNSLFVTSFAARPLLCHLTAHVTATLMPKLPAPAIRHLRAETSEQLAGLRSLLLHYGFADPDAAEDLAWAYYTILLGAVQIAAHPQAEQAEQSGAADNGMADRTEFEVNCLVTLACLR